jgi:DNA mismatch repair protein MutS
MNKKYFITDTLQLHQDYCDLFCECDVFVSIIDYLKNSAKIATLYGYTRPIISNNEKYNNSYICALNMRHPIVERLIDFEYVPHNVELGHNELKGMLIYGLNSSGKSTLMKATGLCIIMAQSGLFVPASSFYYSPYYALYTRITGNDNIFRGLSSFSLEMVELNSILKRADQNTLIIGDEVCRGTEHVSGNAIVAAAIIKLSQVKSSFIFATHLHEIMTVEKIKQLTNVQPFHLEVTYNESTETLEYDRILKEGTGESVYGITVARFIIQDKQFMDIATEIKNELLMSYDSIISGKKSKYNSELYVYECNICGEKDKKSHISNLETHHINFQKNCDKNDLVIGKPHLQKNQKANLVVLCNKCHDKIHNNTIKLKGYIGTSRGKQLVTE